MSVSGSSISLYSYRAYLGMIEKPLWLTTDILLDYFSNTKLLDRINNYRDYVEGKEVDDINHFNIENIASPIIGSKLFKDRILSQIDISNAAPFSPDINRARTVPKIESIIHNVCVFYNVSRVSLLHSQRGQLNWPRLMSLYICRKRYGHTIRSISNSFDSNCHVTISTAIQKCEQRLQGQQHLKNEVDMICESIKREILQGDT